MFLAPSPADAGGDRWGAAAQIFATRFDVFITAYDIEKDGHCAVGRLHTGGRWRVQAKDCSHSPANQGVGSNAISATGTVNGAACITGHGYNSSTCSYGSITMPFGNKWLGGAVYP